MVRPLVDGRNWIRIWSALPHNRRAGFPGTATETDRARAASLVKRSAWQKLGQTQWRKTMCAITIDTSDRPVSPRQFLVSISVKMTRRQTHLIGAGFCRLAAFPAPCSGVPSAVCVDVTRVLRPSTRAMPK